MDCPNCGAANPDNADFCSLCFQKFVKPAVASSPATLAPHSDGVSPVPLGQASPQAPISDDPYNRFLEKPEISLESLITGEPDDRD
jgi:hypothetical protein